MMSEPSPRALQNLMLVTIVALLVTNVGLFWRMNQLQEELLRVLGGESTPPDLTALPPGSRAPAFLTETTGKQEIGLADFENQSVLLVFSSIDCPACQQMYPELKAFAADSDLRILMLSRGSIEQNQQLRETQGFDFPVAQWQDSTARAYEVPATPFFFVLDKDHIVVRADVASEVAEIKALVAALT